VPHSAKRALASATLGKAGKQRPNFPVLSSARAMALGKDFFKFFLPSARATALAKFFKKIKKFLCRVRDYDTRQRIFFKKKIFFAEYR
jgi:hypothetical protein